MLAILVRVAILAAGMAAVETGIGPAVAGGSLTAWGLVILVGLPLIVTGSAGFMAPLFSGANQTESNDA
jgi:hypothetical protein